MKHVADELEKQIRSVASIYSRMQRSFSRMLLNHLMTEKIHGAQSGKKLEKLLREEAELYQQEIISSYIGAMAVTLTIASDQIKSQTSERILSSKEEIIFSQFVQEMSDRFIINISAQINNDVKQILIALKKYLIKAELLVSQKGLSREVALNEGKLAAIDNIENFKRDSLGRKLDSERFVLMELKFSLYKTFNLFMVFMLSKIGRETAVIDPRRSSGNRAVFNLSDFEKIESTIFHINSETVVAAV